MVDRHAIENATTALAERAIAAARELTRDGHALDEHPSHAAIFSRHERQLQSGLSPVSSSPVQYR